MPISHEIKKPAGMFQEEADARYLKLDQTAAQDVINGRPTFNEGILATAAGDTAITSNKDIVLKADRKLIFDG